jgi:hypothetical protein
MYNRSPRNANTRRRVPAFAGRAGTFSNYGLTIARAIHGRGLKKKNQNENNHTMNVIQRMKAPTPKFFRVLRSVGLALAAASGALLAAPVALPAAVITIAGYLTVAGSVATAVSQTAIHKDDEQDDDPSDHVDTE